MTTAQQIPTTLRTGQLAELMGASVATVCRWATQQDERGIALRKARLGKGRFSTAALKDAKLLG